MCSIIILAPNIYIYTVIYYLSRRQIDAENVAIICDIKKKHSAHSITSDVDICETAKAAEFFRADGVILTGSSTGSEANPEELENLHNALGKSSLIIIPPFLYWLDYIDICSHHWH